MHLKLPIGVPIFQSVLECQCDDENWSAKEANWLPWQRPWSDHQMNAGMDLSSPHIALPTLKI